MKKQLDYCVYEKTILGIFVYLFICKVTMTKINFRFYKQYKQVATHFICEWAHSVSLGTDPPSKPQTSNFFCPLRHWKT